MNSSKRKRVFCIIPALLWVIFLVGCRAGGPSFLPPDKPSISQDYMGLEVGAEWIYTMSLTSEYNDEDPVTQQGIISHKVLSMQEQGNKKLFKILESFDVEDWAVDDEYDSGMFWGYIGDIYYNFGYWTNDPDDYGYPEMIYEDPRLLLSNPISLQSTGFYNYYGPSHFYVDSQQSITVEAGTFDAWRFFYTEYYNDMGVVMRYSESIWFVPHVGIVKNAIYFNYESGTESETVRGSMDLTSYTLP